MRERSNQKVVEPRSMLRPGSRRRALAAWGGLVALMGTVAACSTTTSPEQRPSEAEIRITGSSEVPLRLIVSTDFFETFDPVDGRRGQVLVSADTITVSELPYLQTVTLGEISSIVVDLANPAEEPATVRLFVELDGNQPPYDQEAIMSQGGSMRYVYNWVSPEFGS